MKSLSFIIFFKGIYLLHNPYGMILKKMKRKLFLFKAMQTLYILFQLSRQVPAGPVYSYFPYL